MQNAQFFGARQVPNVVPQQVAPPMCTSPSMPVRKRRPRGISDKNGGEKIRVRARLNGFIAMESMIWNEIKRRFGDNIRHGELLSIAEVVAQYSGVFLDRDAKRRKTVLIKWFQENWARIAPFLSCVVLEDKSEKKSATSTTEQTKTTTTNPTVTAAPQIAVPIVYQPMPVGMVPWVPRRM